MSAILQRLPAHNQRAYLRQAFHYYRRAGRQDVGGFYFEYHVVFDRRNVAPIGSGLERCWLKFLAAPGTDDDIRRAAHYLLRVGDPQIEYAPVRR